MQVIILQLSVLIGLLVFLNKLWRHTPLEQTIFQGFVTGLAVYLVLFVGALVVRRVLAYQPPPKAPASEAEDASAPPEQASADADPTPAAA